MKIAIKPLISLSMHSLIVIQYTTLSLQIVIVIGCNVPWGMRVQMNKDYLLSDDQKCLNSLSSVWEAEPFMKILVKRTGVVMHCISFYWGSK